MLITRLKKFMAKLSAGQNQVLPIASPPTRSGIREATSIPMGPPQS